MNVSITLDGEAGNCHDLHTELFLAAENEEVMNIAIRILFQHRDKHRLTLNKDILAATLILALSSVFTSAVEKKKRRQSSGHQVITFTYKHDN